MVLKHFANPNVFHVGRSIDIRCQFFGIPWSNITTNLKHEQSHWWHWYPYIGIHLVTFKSKLHTITREILIIGVSRQIRHRFIIGNNSRDHSHANRFWSITHLDPQQFTRHYFASQLFACIPPKTHHVLTDFSMNRNILIKCDGDIWLLIGWIFSRWGQFWHFSRKEKTGGGG